MLLLAHSHRHIRHQSKMLVLFETPAGYALFKLLDKAKIAKPEDVYKHFDTVEHAQQVYVQQSDSRPMPCATHRPSLLL